MAGINIESQPRKWPIDCFEAVDDNPVRKDDATIFRIWLLVHVCDNSIAKAMDLMWKRIIGLTPNFQQKKNQSHSYVTDNDRRRKRGFVSWHNSVRHFARENETTRNDEFSKNYECGNTLLALRRVILESNCCHFAVLNNLSWVTKCL